MENGQANVYFHFFTAFSYVVLAGQLLAFVSRIKFRSFVGDNDNLRSIAIAIIVLFGCFFILCAASHFIIYMASLYTHSSLLKSVESVILGSMMVVSIFAMLVCLVLFPKLVRLLEQLQTTHIGLFQKITKELVETQHDINNAKLRYISCTAHDLKTPLQSFEYSINLLLNTNLDSNQKYLVKHAEVAVDLMRVTISQAIDISKSLSGAALNPHCSTVSLQSLLNRVQVVISGFGSQVPIHFHISDDVKHNIITDGEWVMQMILNFLTNACKHTESGYINVTAQLSDEGSNVHIKVSDTGIGITAEKQARIFEPFAQAQRHQSTGTGLGLYSVKMRVERLGGSCGVLDNRVNTTHGSTFWFKIPYRQDEDLVADVSSGSRHFTLRSNFKIAPEVLLNENANKSSVSAVPASGIASFSLPQDALDVNEPSRRSQSMRTLTAFVVDDMQSIRKMLAQILTQNNFIVECFPNGAQALDAMKVKVVDVVFMDLQMPIMSGPEAVQRLRAYEKETGRRRQFVVATSANIDSVEELEELGFDLSFSKPIRMREIVQFVDGYIPNSVV